MTTASALARARQAVDAGRHTRIVGHATLLPACADDAQQLRLAVEDALNTADFGDAGRLVLVRRLRILDLPPRASPASVARALESAWRALALHAVPALHTSAASAEAVFFVSRFEARMAWLARLASGQAPAAWFWPAALPELKTPGPTQVDSGTARVMAAALRDSAPELLDAFRRWSDTALAALFRALPPDSQPPLLQALTAPVPVAGTTSPTDRAAARITSGRLRQGQHPVACRLAACAPLGQGAALLLAALWLKPELRRRPSMDEVQALVGSTAAGAGLAVAGSAARTVEAEEPKPSPEDLDGPQARAADSPQRLFDAFMPATGRAQPAAPAAAPPSHASPTARQVACDLPSPARPGAHAGAVHIRAPSCWPWLADAAFTRCGGLMLALNVLMALRFPRWLERLEAAERPRFVVGLLLDCLAIANAGGDDPQRDWFDADAGPLPATRLWTLRLRRTLRRHARMDLAELVCRPAWVSATPTHIDVIYALDDVDLRLRRLGLDADPGWVPWLGRIVSLHFIDARLLPTRSAHG
ncbi:hypothetical protein ACG02S_05295 [Roseateles sp. DC23W]|uniref:Uncharacterized protein n=1 Tax=Pelomonas dachongensis TaxID=3299029 RepID=A0ABW7EIN3_9BURK